MGEKFAVEGKCPECGRNLTAKPPAKYRCSNCRYSYAHIVKETFAGYKLIRGEYASGIFYPAAPTEPTEPSAMVEWVRDMYCLAQQLIEPGVHNPLRLKIRELLATAPVEVRETPQSGEEVKGDCQVGSRNTSRT